MLPDITNKRFCVFGLQGSGKSVLVKSLLTYEPNHMVYDVLNEHWGFNRYIATHRQIKLQRPDDPGIKELNTFVNRVILGTGRIRLFILEEANRYCPPKPQSLPSSILDLNDFQRHERIAFGIVCRRPTQLHSDLVELAHFLFIFQLSGKNDVSYLESLQEGLGEAVKALKPYQFVIVDSGRKFTVHEPVADLSKKMRLTDESL
jgi:hypothetical protein